MLTGRAATASRDWALPTEPTGPQTQRPLPKMPDAHKHIDHMGNNEKYI